MVHKITPPKNMEKSLKINGWNLFWNGPFFAGTSEFSGVYLHFVSCSFCVCVCFFIQPFDPDANPRHVPWTMEHPKNVPFPFHSFEPKINLKKQSSKFASSTHSSLLQWRRDNSSCHLEGSPFFLIFCSTVEFGDHKVHLIFTVLKTVRKSRFRPVSCASAETNWFDVLVGPKVAIWLIQIDIVDIYIYQIYHSGGNTKINPWHVRTQDVYSLHRHTIRIAPGGILFGTKSMWVVAVGKGQGGNSVTILEASYKVGPETPVINKVITPSIGL